MRRVRGPAAGFTLLEAAVALVALVALSTAGVVATRQAQVEFDHSGNRMTLQNLASAASADAAVRGSRFDAGLLQAYVEGRTYGVGGVKGVTVGQAPTSSAPGQVAAVIGEDGLVLSLAMRSSRDRCLRISAFAGSTARVSSQRVSVCSPLDPAVLLSSAVAAPAAAMIVPALQLGLVTLVSWTASDTAALYVVSVAPEGGSCVVLAPATSCQLQLSAGEYTVTVEAQNAAGSSVSSSPLTVPHAVGGEVTFITVDGIEYAVHTFTAVGEHTFVVLADELEVEYLVVGGGGGGGYGRSGGGGGGGAGGMLEGAANISYGSYPAIVGYGGFGGVSSLVDESYSDSEAGGNSVFYSVTAFGGGAGGNGSSGSPTSGGSGGGQAGWTQGTGAAGSAGQGFKGGDHPGGGSSARGGAGGGGAGGTGESHISGMGEGSGAGGPGKGSYILGTENRYGGGGGGGGSGPGGAVDVNTGLAYDGGGNGAQSYVRSGSNATAGTGGGGGGGGRCVSASCGTPRGGSGGSGIVIVRYRHN